MFIGSVDKVFHENFLYKREYLQNTQIERQIGNNDQTGGSYGKRAANGSNQTDGSYTEKLNDWNLVLVNQWNSLSEDYEIPLIDIGGNTALFCGIPMIKVRLRGLCMNRGTTVM